MIGNHLSTFTIWVWKLHTSNLKHLIILDGNMGHTNQVTKNGIYYEGHCKNS